MLGRHCHYRSSTRALRELLEAILSIGTTLSLVLMGPPLRAQTPADAEYRAKANFLSKVSGFVEWPADALPLNHGPFLVCVLGSFSFGTSLAELSRGTTVHGGRLEVRWIRKDEESRSCHILFVSQSEQKRYRRVLEKLSGQKVLTVGETPEFLDAGGILCFSMEEGALRFEVNLDEATKSHLKISSRLLALARRVVNRGEAAKS